MRILAINILLACLIFGCNKPETKDYNSERNYYDLDTIYVQDLTINNVSLEGSKEGLSKLGQLVNLGSREQFTRVPSPDSTKSRLATGTVENFFGESASGMYLTQVQFIGNEFLSFEETRTNYTLYILDISESSYRVKLRNKEVDIMKLKACLKLFPKSAKWLNDYIYHYNQVLVDLNEPQWEYMNGKKVHWFPFSNGKGGTIHFIYLNKKLAFIKHNYSEI